MNKRELIHRALVWARDYILELVPGEDCLLLDEAMEAMMTYTHEFPEIYKDTVSGREFGVFTRGEIDWDESDDGTPFWFIDTLTVLKIINNDGEEYDKTNDGLIVKNKEYFYDIIPNFDTMELETAIEKALESDKQVASCELEEHRRESSGR